MTKKRFIKLVMSKGKGRNEAQKIASAYNSRRISYDKAYKIFRMFNCLAVTFIKCKAATKRFIDAVKSAIREVEKLKNLALADKPTVETEVKRE